MFVDQRTVIAYLTNRIKPFVNNVQKNGDFDSSGLILIVNVFSMLKKKSLCNVLLKKIQNCTVQFIVYDKFSEVLSNCSILFFLSQNIYIYIISSLHFTPEKYFF